MVSKYQRLTDSARYYLLQISEKYNEFRFGIATAGFLRPWQLGISNPDSIEYAPAPYRNLFRILNYLAIRHEDHEVFLDIGCGMGRAVAVASQYPFARVIGVELSEELARIAQKNAAQVRRVCPHVEIVHADATQYRIPPDVSVIFFYNPFRGETLHQAVSNIMESLILNPRKLRIVYYNRVYFDAEIQGKRWIRKVFYTPCFPRASWAVYEADSFALK